MQGVCVMFTPCDLSRLFSLSTGEGKKWVGQLWEEPPLNLLHQGETLGQVEQLGNSEWRAKARAKLGLRFYFFEKLDCLRLLGTIEPDINM